MDVFTDAAAEEIAGVEVVIAQEVEGTAVEGIGPRLGDGIDQAAAVIAEFRVEVIGDDAKLGQRIEVGQDRRSTIVTFLDVAAVDVEAIGHFPVAAYGVPSVASVVCAAVRGDAGLKRQQAEITAAVQRDGRDAVAADDFAHLGAGGLHLQRGRLDADVFGL